MSLLIKALLLGSLIISSIIASARLSQLEERVTRLEQDIGYAEEVILQHIYE